MPAATTTTRTRSALFALALVAATGNAAKIENAMDTPLPFSIYPDGSGCGGDQKLASGIVSSVTPLAREGHFCENTVQFGATEEEETTTTVYTKVVVSSCDAVRFGTVFVDARSCSDAACADCDDGAPVPANLAVPAYEPLPAADACWGITADATGVTVLNRFDAGADATGIDAYWSLYRDHSCLKDAPVVAGAALAAESASSSFAVAPSGVCAATAVAVAAASLVLH
mmetsp:Transcript_1850/g.3449  ORF Transcript_1850/g.3449 Transcript_1850/m.3449 type:complete len:228 (+) Transcript_1850:299-982(+)